MIHLKLIAWLGIGEKGGARAAIWKEFSLHAVATKFSRKRWRIVSPKEMRRPLSPTAKYECMNNLLP